MEPKNIKGDCHIDHRGSLFYNSNFDATAIKRMYVIENKDETIVRGWQGHKIEQRWFSAILGTFKIKLVKIDNWEFPCKDLLVTKFILSSNELNILHVPIGYATCIQALNKNAKLLVMTNYFLGEKEDEYRYPINYFK